MISEAPDLTDDFLEISMEELKAVLSHLEQQMNAHQKDGSGCIEVTFDVDGEGTIVASFSKTRAEELIGVAAEILEIGGSDPDMEYHVIECYPIGRSGEELLSIRVF